MNNPNPLPFASAVTGHDLGMCFACRRNPASETGGGLCVGCDHCRSEAEDRDYLPAAHNGSEELASEYE